MSLHHQIMQDSPAGYWPLDETSGTTVFDRSGNGRNGSVVGSGVTPHAGGPAGLRAMAFSGAASTYLSWAYNAAFDTHAGANVMDVASAGASPLDTWKHVAMVYDRAAQLLIIYADGVEVARDTTASGNTAATGGGHYLGNRHDTLGSGTYAWNGRMAQFAIFPTALSAARIKAHYEAGIRSGVVV